MPELAEVEFYRKQWDPGLGHRFQSVSLHPNARVWRGIETGSVERLLTGAVLEGSEAHGKQMLFRFSGHLWLGLHLGMSGRLHQQAPSFQPARHDHLVLCSKTESLVFTDPRQFGRMQWHAGANSPAWWSNLPVPILSPAFTPHVVGSFLDRHARLPIKAALLLQDGFPGVGNWMADEILWRSALHPALASGRVPHEKRRILWETTRFVCRRALDTIGKDFSDPPRGWLFHERWTAGGRCPKHRTVLVRETVGGRTSAWCTHCQKRR